VTLLLEEEGVVVAPPELNGDVSGTPKPGVNAEVGFVEEEEGVANEGVNEFV
jgi:hypothetical protein